MAETKKPLSEYDASQVMQKSYNSEGSTLGVEGFVAGKLGRKIELAISTTTVANDTESWTYSEDGTTLYVLTVIYTDGNRDTMISVERTV